MTSTFSWIPGYAPELQQQPRVLVAQFGDGYQQRAADGLNAGPQIWSLTFPHVSDTVADLIVNFLRAAGGAVPFFWTPPRSTTQIAVVCQSWRRQVANRNANNLYMTFEQVPELGLVGGAGSTDWDGGGTIWD